MEEIGFRILFCCIILSVLSFYWVYLGVSFIWKMMKKLMMIKK